jgi:hypothetical protein
MEILDHARSLRCFRGSRAGGPAFALGLVMALGSCLAAESPEQPFDEYRVKAAFLYNFAKFVQWPPESFESPTVPFAICVLGRDPFGRSLDDTVAGRTIEGRSFVVRHIASVKQVAGCHVLFIGAAESKRVLPMLAEIRTMGVLTVGESDGAAPEGAIISFRLEAGKVRFAIDTANADRAKLRISSKLLSLAIAVAK